MARGWRQAWELEAEATSRCLDCAGLGTRPAPKCVA
jgi:hypothetical protein